MPGLSAQEAASRLQSHGRNELQHEAATPWWRVLLGQFQGALVWLLLGACVISALLTEVGDAIAIAAILVINATDNDPARRTYRAVGSGHSKAIVGG
jgi:Ca2+-transporting ATPase